MKIPKLIHYCWFGRSPLPELAVNCLNSWKRYLPDYKIIEWNEDNFDVNIVAYTAEAYKLKKYAFVSDYARFYILYKYGGLYFDTDVEVIKPINDILEKGPFFGCELAPENNENPQSKLISQIAPGLGLGVYKEHPVYKKILDSYKGMHVTNWQGRYNGTVVSIVTDIIKKERPDVALDKIDRVGDVFFYPSEYFCPIVALTGEKSITSNTRSVHHYTGTWVNKDLRFWSIFKDRTRRICAHYYGVMIWPLLYRGKNENLTEQV